MNIGFFIDKPTTYDYAFYNETLLHNKSYIFYIDDCPLHYQQRFECFQVRDDLQTYIDTLHLTFCYDVPYDTGIVWTTCTPVYHDRPGNGLRLSSVPNDHEYPIVPYIVHLPLSSPPRFSLPDDVVVISLLSDIDVDVIDGTSVHFLVRSSLIVRDNVHVVGDTIYLCDAVIIDHYDLFVSDYGIMGIPIITKPTTSLDKYIPYETSADLIDVLNEFKTVRSYYDDWTTYTQCTPEIVMPLFLKALTSKKIIDCFIFYKEEEFLKKRVRLLESVVDFFVMVESAWSFMGRPKELQSRKFHPKIVHVVLDTLPFKTPQNGEQWENEHYQRNAIDQGLKRLNLNFNDIVIISDIDEFPNPQMLEHLKKAPILRHGHIYATEQEFYYYDLKHKFKQKWYHQRLVLWSTYNGRPESIRSTNEYSIITNGGWHLSYFGGTSAILEKLRNFSHQEHAHLSEEHIHNAIQNHRDLFDRPNPLEFERGGGGGRGGRLSSIFRNSLKL
jgi:beta-1,4-mannosyl-glycoprotein beta-1,4-N-acetylglucosaminyltransferase